MQPSIIDLLLIECYDKFNQKKHLWRGFLALLLQNWEIWLAADGHVVNSSLSGCLISLVYIFWLILFCFMLQRFFLKKVPRPGGRTWDLLVFVYFLSLKQRLRPLGYCAPLCCCKDKHSFFMKIFNAAPPRMWSTTVLQRHFNESKFADIGGRGRHSTEVAFALLTPPTRVRFSARAFPRKIIDVAARFMTASSA